MKLKDLSFKRSIKIYNYLVIKQEKRSINYLRNEQIIIIDLLGYKVLSKGYEFHERHKLQELTQTI